MNRSSSWTRTISGNDKNSSFSLPSLELNSLWDQLRQSQTLCCQQARCKKAQFLSSNFLFSWLYNSTFVKTLFLNSISSVQSFLLPNNNQHNLKSHSKRLLLPNLLLFIVIIYPDSHHCSDEDCFCAIQTFLYLNILFTNFVPYLQLLKAEA